MNEISNLPEGQRKLALSCISKTFYIILPNLVDISNDPMIRQHIDCDINSLGVEGALEMFISLFEEGRLKIVADAPDNFIVYTIQENILIFLYDTEEEKMRNEDYEQ